MISNHLLDQRKYSSIAPSNRAQLIDDALNLARAGYLNYGISLNVTRYLVHETEYVPWKAAIGALNFIDSMLIKTSSYDKFKVAFIIFKSIQVYYPNLLYFPEIFSPPS